MTDPRLQPGLLSRMESPTRVAIVRASRIGDFLCAVPAFRALRVALPDAQITLIGLPFVRDLVDRTPYLDRFVPFPGYPGMAEQFFDARRTADFLGAMQEEQFDLAIQMHGSGANSNPFTLMLGARATAGYIVPGSDPGRLDAALPYPEGPEVQRTLDLAHFLGAPHTGNHLEFPLHTEDEAEADRLLRDAPRPLIGLHPGARDRTKRWPVERFAAVGAALQGREGGTVVIVGGEEEREAAVALARSLPALDLTGRTSLPVLGAVIRRLAVLVTNDSGPAHIAYALRTPCVTIFGSTDPRIWGPADATRHHMLAHPVPCRPCSYAECPIGYPCLEGVTVEMVVAAALQAGPLTLSPPPNTRVADAAPEIAVPPRSTPH